MRDARQQPAPDRASGEGIRRFSSVEFLAALVLLLVMSPFLQDVRWGDAVEALLMTVVLLSAVAAIGGRKRTMAAATVLVAPAVAGRWIDHFRPGLIPPGLTVALGIVFVSFVTAHLLVFVIRAPRVNLEVLCAALSAYLMLGILWALAFVLTEMVSPGCFAYAIGPPATHVMKGFQALYFSFQNLCGAAYGDIMPLSNGARALSMAEAATSMFYMTVLIARLVGAYSSR
jgi:hypothetical protein